MDTALYSLPGSDQGSSGVQVWGSWEVRGPGMFWRDELAKLRSESVGAIPVAGWLSVLFPEGGVVS